MPIVMKHRRLNTFVTRAILFKRNMDDEPFQDKLIGHMDIRHEQWDKFKEQVGDRIIYEEDFQCMCCGTSEGDK